MTKLKKELGFIDITLATIGFIVGAGIYAIIGIASKFGKNFTWLSVVICGLLSICTGMSYCELTTIFKKNGGEYLFVKETMGEKAAKITGYFIVITETLVISSIAFALGNHLSTFIPFNEVLLSIFSLLLFAYLNYKGIRDSVNYNNLSTLIEVIGLLFIIFAGIKNIKLKDLDITKIKYNDVMPILMGSALIYFAFFGFDIIIELTEETKEAEKTIPRAMIIGVIISTLLYIFVALSAVSSIGWKNLSKSKAPIVDVAKKLLNSNVSKIIFIIAIISMSNTLLMGHVGSARFIQSVSKQYNLPFNLEKIDEKTQTPKNSIIFLTIATLFGMFLKNLENTTLVTNFATLIIFFLVNLSNIILRIKKPEINRPFKVPLNIKNIPITSIIGGLSSIIFCYLIIKNNMFNLVNKI